MNKKTLTVLATLLMIGSAFALTASEAKQLWLDTKSASIEAQATHRQAKLDYAANTSPENNQAVIDTGKIVLNAALDEVEAWLNWKNLEVEENPGVPDYISEAIQSDVEENLGVIDSLRIEVDAIQNRLGLGVVFLRMIGRYVELLGDVARNSGAMWSYIVENRSAIVSNWESTLRTQALAMTNNTEVIAKLDLARAEIDSADTNIANAKTQYELISVPGTPLINFANGNNYLRIARGDLVSAAGYLKQALILMVGGST